MSEFEMSEQNANGLRCPNGKWTEISSFIASSWTLQTVMRRESKMQKTSVISADMKITKKQIRMYLKE